MAEMDPEEITDEEFQTAIEAQGALLCVFAIDGDRGVADIIDLAGMEGAAEAEFTEVGRVEDVTFYLYDEPQMTDEYTARLTPDFAEEFSMLREKLVKALKNAEYFVPVVPGAGLVGKTLSFETTDLDGNAVKSEDLFAPHELTMVNIWTTWCGPCKGELAGLGQMNRRLAEKDAAVEGAMVQFCSDEACMIGKTDANGVAAFEVEEGRSYTVHILKNPEGYEKNDEELTVQDVSNTVSVVLRNAA